MPIQLVTRTKAPLLTTQSLKCIFRTTKRYVAYPDYFTVTVIAVNKPTMRKLNQQYRGLDAVTDVLSFPYDTATGEIVICYAQAVAQAKAKQTFLPQELKWLIIHGILHLLGYDHETAKEAKIMRPLEQLILHHV